MKKIAILVIVSVLTLGLNFSYANAYTYVSTKTSGNYSEALYYEDTTTRIDPMSSWFEFTSSGGSLGYSDAYSKTTSYSATATLGTIWSLAQVQSSLGVSYSTNRTIGSSAQWNITKKCRARIVTRWYRRKARVYRYNVDHVLINTYDSTPTRTSSAIGIQEESI